MKHDRRYRPHREDWEDEEERYQRELDAGDDRFHDRQMERLEEEMSESDRNERQ